MPLIFLQTQDGARIAVPEEAAQLSGMVRRVLDSWEEMYGFASPGTAIDGDTYVCSDSDSERTPDRIGDEDYDGHRSGMRSLNVGSINDVCEQSLGSKSALRGRKVNGFERACYGREQGSPSRNSDDTDGTASVLDDDEADNDSPSPSPVTFSLPTVCTHGGKAESEAKGTTPRGHEVGLEGDRQEKFHASGDKTVPGNSGGFTPLEHHVPLRGDKGGTSGDDSATPSTLDDDESRGSGEEEEIQAGMGGEEGGCKDELSQKRSSTKSREVSPSTNTAAHAITLGSDDDELQTSDRGAEDNKDPPSLSAEVTPETLERDGKTSNVESSPSEVCGSRMSKDEELVTANKCSPVAAAVVSPRTDEAEEGLTQEVFVASGTGSVMPFFTPNSQTNEGLVSPGSYHQRTPCMIGDEDDSTIPSGDCASPTIEETLQLETTSRPLCQHSSKGKDVSSPIEGSSRFSGERSLSPRGLMSSMRADSVSQTRKQQPNSSALGDDGDDEGANGEVEGRPMRQCMHITDKEIVIKLQNWFCDSNEIAGEWEAAGKTESRRSGASSNLEISQTIPFHSSHKSSLGKSASSSTLRPSNTCIPADLSAPLDGAPSLEVSTTSETRKIHSARGPRADERASRPYRTPSTDAVRYCAVYLRHFATIHQQHPYENSRQEQLLPTLAPEPLTAPLVALLTPWERNFIYRDILGQTEEQVSRAMEIVEHSPNMSYTYPTPFLKVSGISRVLLVEPPAAERVALLLRVMRAAEVLQVPSLRSLCAAWCADFIVRASYGARDHFEAAALVRRCFQVQNDWSRKEMDCLKLENEWPVNEEE
ncbi:hypothetical protein, conserved [Trypanosoma brucei brucei TREU927]|uniref:Uncharacterized protein n=1 Tax=Trypanosoma brucei brucei (strain 927/4 GUTat10.1) TaxID=185431 RepID=Q382K2_TRYB2|nr:hypothetical protein, conserved [Trypanosoma brucei brucei TREU927]EAN80279.1 hypothetical protein, conserved [Trypanosoma brucei brucei TREU927]